MNVGTIGLTWFMLHLLVVSATNLEGWERRSKAQDGVPHTVRLGLAYIPGQIEKLEELFWTVSNPASPQYRQFASLSDVSSIVGAPAPTVSVVSAWSRSIGLSEYCHLTATQDYYECHAPVSMLESAFGVEFHEFVHTSGLRRVRCLPGSSLKLHDKVLQHVDLSRSSGLCEFLPVAQKFASPRVGEAGMNIEPSQIYQQYRLTNESFSTEKNGVAVAEFEQAYFYPDDLTNFLKEFHFPVRNATIIGKNNPNSGYLGEASLDVEYISAVAYNLPLTDFSLPELDLVAYAQKVLATPDAPLIHSISWGSGESAYEANTRASWNAELMKLGSMGYSVFAAAGDSGTGHTGIFGCGKFDPTFPASSPYITAVGGTYITSVGGSETAWVSGGGGFSAVFSRPSYQSAAAAEYLKQPGLPSTQYYNNSGRGIPDVSALSTNYQVLIQNFLGPLSGTSAATPVFAGCIGRINALRRQAGKAPMGFVNPTLYALAEHEQSVTTDVTAGYNQDSSCPKGFPATEGWDAVTGLGTPRYDLMKKLLLD